MMAFLTKHRTPREHADRELRMGDAFACKVRAKIPKGKFIEPDRWIVPPVIDVSAQAREAAKLAYFSAAAPLVTRKADREILAIAKETIPLPSKRVRSAPDTSES
jgi:hypothetical protein